MGDPLGLFLENLEKSFDSLEKIRLGRVTGSKLIFFLRLIETKGILFINKWNKGIC